MISERILRYIFFYIFCIGTALVLLPRAGADVIKVNKYTSVNDSRDLFLIDIVDQTGLNQEVRKVIEKVKITNAPKIGEKRVLSNRSLSKLLRKSIREVKKESTFRLKIPSEVVIENLGRGFTKQSASAKIERTWKSQCLDCEFKMDMLSLPKVSVVDVKAWKIQVSELPKGSFTYPVVVTDESGVDHKYWLQGQARVFKPVAVTTRHMAFGQTIREGDLKTEMREVTFAYDKPLSESAALGLQLKRAITEGFVIWQNAVQAPLSVKRGQPVKLILEDEGWSLSIQGIAQDQGHIGDLVSVRNPRSNKLLTGKIVSEGEILVK